MELTQKEMDIVLFIRSFIADKKYPPSFREIAKGARFASMSTLHPHMIRLREKGYIGYEDRKSRALWVTEKGEALFCQETPRNEEALKEEYNFWKRTIDNVKNCASSIPKTHEDLGYYNFAKGFVAAVDKAGVLKSEEQEAEHA